MLADLHTLLIVVSQVKDREFALPISRANLRSVGAERKGGDLAFRRPRSDRVTAARPQRDLAVDAPAGQPLPIGADRQRRDPDISAVRCQFGAVRGPALDFSATFRVEGDDLPLVGADEEHGAGAADGKGAGRRNLKLTVVAGGGNPTMDRRTVQREEGLVVVTEADVAHIADKGGIRHDFFCGFPRGWIAVLATSAECQHDNQQA